MKILLVGLGDWGSKHRRVLESLPVELFCSDADPAKRGGAVHFSVNYTDFLTAVDAVVIVTPGPTHFALALQCLEAGKDVFVEKPLAITVEECRRLAEVADARGRILQVGHIFRFDASSQWLRDAIVAKKLGALRMLRGRFCGFKRPRKDGGGMISDGIHFVDLFNFLLDATPRTVQAIHRDFLGRGMDDLSILSLEYPVASGPVWASVETDYFTPGKYREVTIVGSEATAVCDFSALSNKIAVYQNSHTGSGAVAGPVSQYDAFGEEPLLVELKAFLHSVAHRTPSIADGWAGYEAVRVMSAAMESARSSRVITMK